MRFVVAVARHRSLSESAPYLMGVDDHSRGEDGDGRLLSHEFAEERDVELRPRHFLENVKDDDGAVPARAAQGFRERQVGCLRLGHERFGVCCAHDVERGALSDVFAEAFDWGVVDAKDGVMRVNLSPEVALLEQARVAHHSARAELPRRLLLRELLQQLLGEVHLLWEAERLFGVQIERDVLQLQPNPFLRRYSKHPLVSRQSLRLLFGSFAEERPSRPQRLLLPLEHRPHAVQVRTVALRRALALAHPLPVHLGRPSRPRRSHADGCGWRCL
mmetsp:Transcript_25618/g.84346  ORF Transcript_25618/g.84346 Transcript_25618/m.84346 type:complete len:274 (+) Transcript_25618:1867-2688(+)